MSLDRTTVRGLVPRPDKLHAHVELIMGKVKRKKAATVLAKKKQKLEGQELNPFEVRVNRKKHHVLGQRSKSDQGLPGVSRSKAILKRKRTLLLEYKQRNKSNRFIDRRFGEYDEGLTPEEKMMKRFVLEKQRKHERLGAYNLDEEEELTHYGQSLGDMERFDDIQLSEEEVEEEDIGETHFGGFLKRRKQSQTSEESKPKTRKQVMEEIVSKSKAMKYERQHEKLEAENLMEKLNSEWKEIQISISSTMGKDVPKSSDDYDVVVRELAFERRGKPTDRMKSEEEIAREEKERLEKLEADRVRRMKGLTANSSKSTDHISADYIPERPSSRKDDRMMLFYKDGRMVLPEGLLEHDVLPGDEDNDVSAEEDSGESEEDEEEEEVGGEGTGSEGGSEDKEEESDGEDPGGTYGSDLDTDSDQEGEGEEEEEDGKDLGGLVILGGDESEKEEKKGDKSQGEEVHRMQEKASKELPYTFKVPRTLQEFRTIVDERSPEECVTAVERIHSCNHPFLSSENQRKLEHFFGVIVEYCLFLGKNFTTTGLATLNKLARPLFKLAQMNPAHTATVFIGLLQGAHKRWRKGGHRLYPPFPDIILFKLIGLLFPTSDYQHSVVTPAMLFMGQLLLKCHVRSVQDLLYGILVCQLLVEYISLSKRFVPEVVNFVTSVLGCFSGSKDCVLYPPFSAKSKLRNELSSSEELPAVETLPNHPLVLLVTGGCRDGNFSTATILNSTLKLALQLIELYTGLPSFPEIFTPISINIQRLNGESWPPPTQTLCAEMVERVATQTAVPRTVLQLLKQKPKSIKFYEPKFEQVYEVDRRRARSKVTAQRHKLKHKVKREMKGAIREIRRDNVFLTKEKLRETLERDTKREQKTKQLLHELQTMQHEAKMERIKKKK